MKKKKKTEELVDFTVLSMKYKTKLTKKFENRTPYKAPNPNEILSYIPGTIVEIFVEEGEEVKEGTSLLVLEAMKMRNLITMPKTGIIKSIKVTIGDRIPKNKVMLVIK
jgi:biotin carboxyl carrier protein